MPLLPIHNERSDFDLVVTLEDKEGDPLVPTKARYHIYDRTNEQAVKDWTVFTVAGTGIGTVEVAAADLGIIDDANEYEERVVTIQAEYGASKEYHDEYAFLVKNLVVVPRVVAGP